MCKIIDLAILYLNIFFFISKVMMMRPRTRTLSEHALVVVVVRVKYLLGIQCNLQSCSVYFRDCFSTLTVLLNTTSGVKLRFFGANRLFSRKIDAVAEIRYRNHALPTILTMIARKEYNSSVLLHTIYSPLSNRCAEDS